MRRSLLSVLALAALVACGQSSLDRPSSTITYSAKHQSRTVDSTGFVDNSGATSEERSRTEMSGMRASETGGQNPVGTPGSGTALPVERGGVERRGEETSVVEGADGSLGGDRVPGPGAPGDMLVARIARARCDRETACNRIGEGKRFATSEQCTNALRERSRADVVGASCDRGFDSTQVALCLTTIRQVACDAALAEVSAIPQCQSSTLCVP